MTDERTANRPPAWPSLGAALLLALGLMAAGLAVGEGFRASRSAERYVTVKGLAEQMVAADLALWSLRTTATGNDLEQVQGKIDGDLAAITSFLKSQGFDDEEIRPQRVEVTDLLAQAYRTEGVGDNRYIIAQNILVRSAQVERVAGLSRATGALVKQGVVLVDSGGPTYLFTKLNDIKPAMLAAASSNARMAAEQFAQQVASRIGGIRRASQGVFEILPGDPAPDLLETSQVDKKIRVVATIEYLLED